MVLLGHSVSRYERLLNQKDDSQKGDSTLAYIHVMGAAIQFLRIYQTNIGVQRATCQEGTS